MATSFPILKTSCAKLDAAYKIALADLSSNLKPFCDGLLQNAKECIIAGKGYDTPWTRDTAINTWNGAGILIPDTAKNTLLSVLCKDENGLIIIGGQYWDAIIWITGAWEYYLHTGDKDFVKFAWEVSENSIAYFESTEFDSRYGLFKGPACYGDGVAAYPDDVLGRNGKSVYIWRTKEHAYETRPKEGAGIDFFSLSTNCLYFNAYKLLPLMAKAAGSSVKPEWNDKGEKLKQNIQKHFWCRQIGAFRYVIHEGGHSEHQEGLGHCFAILFGVADPDQTQSILRKQHITSAGIPCVWPTFSRYAKSPNHYGRHSGTVWPHIQGFWAEAAIRNNRPDLFLHELNRLMEHAVRDGQFVEIYHPDTGASYGGLQELNPEFLDNPYFKDFKNDIPVGYEDTTIRLFKSCERQTWSATAFIRMVLKGIFGIDFQEDGLQLQPFLPEQITSAEIQGLNYRDRELNLRVQGAGSRILDFTINGKSLSSDQTYVRLSEMSKACAIEIKVG